MRYLRYALIAIAALAAVALSVANRAPVDVAVAPDLSAYGLPIPTHFQVPLFLLCLGSGAIGFVLGAAREYLREARIRARVSAQRREVAALKTEIGALKAKHNVDEDDDIIALTAR